MAEVGYPKMMSSLLFYHKKEKTPHSSHWEWGRWRAQAVLLGVILNVEKKLPRVNLASPVGRDDALLLHLSVPHFRKHQSSRCSGIHLSLYLSTSLCFWYKDRESDELDGGRIQFLIMHLLSGWWVQIVSATATADTAGLEPATPLASTPLSTRVLCR